MAGTSDLRTVAEQAEQSPTGVRSALFAAAPLVVDTYGNAAATLAADWYEELRDEASPSAIYVPHLVVPVNEDDIAAIVAANTQSLYDLEREMAAKADAIVVDFRQAFEDSLAAVE